MHYLSLLNQRMSLNFETWNLNLILNCLLPRKEGAYIWLSCRHRAASPNATPKFRKNKNVACRRRRRPPRRSQSAVVSENPSGGCELVCSHFSARARPRNVVRCELIHKGTSRTFHQSALSDGDWKKSFSFWKKSFWNLRYLLVQVLKPGERKRASRTFLISCLYRFLRIFARNQTWFALTSRANNFPWLAGCSGFSGASPHMPPHFASGCCELAGRALQNLIVTFSVAFKSTFVKQLGTAKKVDEFLAVVDTNHVSVKIIFSGENPRTVTAEPFFQF